MNKKIIKFTCAGAVMLSLTGLVISKNIKYNTLQEEYVQKVKSDNAYQQELNKMIDKLISQLEQSDSDFDKLQKKYKTLQKINAGLRDQISAKEDLLDQLTKKIKGHQTSTKAKKTPENGNKKVSNKTTTATASDTALLERLVQCEAGGESLEGKIAVANVVLNRVKSKTFPNTIYDVIYQKGQFQPVGNGAINTAVPSEETKEAVKKALAGEKVVADNVKFFWATWVRPSHSIWQHLTPMQTIGGHHFATDWIN